jgi:hypothetical protein
VASNGLIEKVRTNNILQSNSFDTTWDNVSTSETSGQAGYDGTNNAWLLDSTGGFLRTTGIGVTSGLNTFSVYAKKGTADGVRLRIDAATDANCYIDLNDGSEIIAHTGVYLSVVSVGSGWYRIGLAINDATISNLRIYPTDDTGVETTGNIVIQNSQWEQGDIPTDYIATTTAAVSVGPVSGLPRLDYLNSTCPKLLLEPQRSNLAQYSEQFDNAYWEKLNSTVTANAAVSPDGYTNADKLIDDSTNSIHRIRRSFTILSNTTYIFSVFLKKAELDYAIVSCGGSSLTGSGGSGADRIASINLNNGNIVTNNYNINVVEFGNGWYRVSISLTTDSDGGTFSPYISTSENGITGTYVGSGKGIYLYAAQLELGSYATSYIPTLGASVTRVAETALKTSVSSLIGASAGVVYFEGTIEGDAASTRRVISISDGTTSNFLNVYNPVGTRGLDFVSAVGGAVQCNIVSSTSIFQYGQRFKMAFAYAQNDFAFYINGTQIGIDGSGNIPSGLDRIIFGRGDQSAAVFFEGNVSQTLLFKTRLTNAQLASLTSL